MEKNPWMEKHNRKTWWITAWLLVFMLAIIACRFTVSESRSGQIAYVGMDHNIYTIDQFGENNQAVTQSNADGEEGNRIYQQPTWSRDSNRVAFIQLDRRGDGTQTATLFTAQPDGSDLVETFSSEDQFPFYLYWSPDNQQLSFLTTAGSESGLVLYMVSPQGGDAQVLEVGQPFYWDWSPDSSSILTHTGGSARLNPQARLALLDVKGELGETELNLKPASFQAPQWSPDGEKLLLAAETDSEGESLLLADTQGEILSELSTLENSIAFSWSPDGKWIAYVSEDIQGPGEVSRRLFYLEADKADELHSVEDELVVAYFWSPDSQKIAYFVPQISISSEQEVSLPVQEPQFLLEVHVFDLQTGSSQRLIEFTPTEDFLNILPFFDQYQRSATIWSPDSEHVVVSALDQDGEQGIYAVRVSENPEIQRLASGRLGFWSWR